MFFELLFPKRDLGFRVQGLGWFRVLGSGFGFRVLGFRVWGSGFYFGFRAFKV